MRIDTDALSEVIERYRGNQGRQRGSRDDRHGAPADRQRSLIGAARGERPLGESTEPVGEQRGRVRERLTWRAQDDRDQTPSDARGGRDQTRSRASRGTRLGPDGPRVEAEERCEERRV